jgi:hypothetical protein
MSSESARECLHRTMALEGSREGKGEAECTYCIAVYSLRHQSTRQSFRSSPPTILDQTGYTYSYHCGLKGRIRIKTAVEVCTGPGLALGPRPDPARGPGLVAQMTFGSGPILAWFK